MKLNMKDMCALLTVIIYGTGSFVWKLINAKLNLLHEISWTQYS